VGPEVQGEVPRDPHLNQVEDHNVQGQAGLAQDVDEGLRLVGRDAGNTVTPEDPELRPQNMAGKDQEKADSTSNI
jgi:hypothetical protein